MRHTLETSSYPFEIFRVKLGLAKYFVLNPSYVIERISDFENVSQISFRNAS